MDGRLQGQHLPFPDVVAQESGEGPVPSGMGGALAQRSVGGIGPTVGAHEAEGMGQELLHVLLAHAVPDHAHAPAVGLQQAEREGVGLLAPLPGQVTQLPTPGPRRLRPR